MVKAVTKIKLRKGDLIVVTRGRLKGQTGRVTATHPRLNAVSVENLNLFKKHHKGTPAQPTSGIIEQIRPIHVSKVAIVDASTQKPTKIGYRFDDTHGKQRIYKRSQQVISQPAKQS